MPFLAPIGIAIAAAIAWIGPIGMAILSTVIVTGLGFAIKALTPKPKAPDFTPFRAVVADRTQMIRQPIVKRRYPFGEIKVGGILVNMVSSEDNSEHRMIVVLCDGPIDGIPVVWFDDQPIWADQIDGAGEVVAGPFAGRATVNKYLGTTSQAANPNLASNFRGRGIAYLDCLIRWNQDVFPNGLPSISAELRALKFFDPRDSVTKFTMNNALIGRGILSNATWGGGYSDDYLPAAYINAAANICDEFVTAREGSHSVAMVVGDTFKLFGAKLLFQTGDRVEVSSDASPGIPAGTPSPGYVIVVRSRNRGPGPEWEVGFDGDGPEKLEVKLADSYEDAVAGVAATLSDEGAGSIVLTKTGEPRYTCNGMMESSDGWLGVLSQVIEAMAGRGVDAGGEWRIRAGAYVAPEVEIVGRDIVAPPKIQTRIPIRDRLNLVTGKYFNPLNDWQPADYPAVTDAAFVTEDGGEKPRDLDLAFTSRSNTAQRLGKIELLRTRGNQITVDLKCSLKAMQLQAGDNFMLTLADFGFDEKPFEVQTWELAVENDGGSSLLVVAMTAREVQPSIYSFNPDDDEVEVLPIPRSTLANPLAVPAPTGLYARTTSLETEAGDTLFSAVLSWSIMPDSTVIERGRFEIGYRRSTGLGLLFDGINDYVDFDAEIDLDGAPQAFTIEVSISWDGATGDDNGIWTNGQAWLYRRDSDGKIVGAVKFDDSPATIVEVVSSAALGADIFTAVALVWDGAELRLYIDAGLEDSAAAVGDLTPELIIPQYGRGLENVDSPTVYWSGVLDELRVWRHLARSEVDLAEHMLDVLTGREELLAGYWPSDERLVGSIADGTLNANTGTIHGAVYAAGAVAPAWEPSWFVDGHQLQTGIPSLDAGVNYDLRVRAVNSVGVRSAWSYLFGFTVGSVGGAATSGDWGLVTESAGTSDDWGSVDDASTSDEDWGTVF